MMMISLRLEACFKLWTKKPICIHKSALYFTLVHGETETENITQFCKVVLFWVCICICEKDGAFFHNDCSRSTSLKMIEKSVVAQKNLFVQHCATVASKLPPFYCQKMI